MRLHIAISESLTTQRASDKDPNEKLMTLDFKKSRKRLRRRERECDFSFGAGDDNR